MARSAQTGDLERDAFDLYDHIFPIRGRHDFGGSRRRRSAPGGRGTRHQGHDVFAELRHAAWWRRAAGACKFKQYHAAAGNYIVIDGDGHATSTTSTCTSPSRPRSRPATASTPASGSAPWATRGNAHGCHLHFELWGAPGWYDGGEPFDPLPSLQAWDSWS